MNQKKKTKVLLIIIIVLFVILLLAGGAFAYFATDIFKSDKELFFKYISQISDSEKGFLNDDLNNYLEKKETIPYNNQGNFSVNISEDENPKIWLLKDRNYHKYPNKAKGVFKKHPELKKDEDLIHVYSELNRAGGVYDATGSRN